MIKFDDIQHTCMIDESIKRVSQSYYGNEQSKYHILRIVDKDSIQFDLYYPDFDTMIIDYNRCIELRSEQAIGFTKEIK